jgi:hypothetical protein
MEGDIDNRLDVVWRQSPEGLKWRERERRDWAEFQQRQQQFMRERERSRMQCRSRWWVLRGEERERDREVRECLRRIGFEWEDREKMWDRWEWRR